ncbi:MAG: NUDIX domain-containing protein [Candidatus Merdivicinus sp.]|jgi:ADP-ribose pyrophosphatase
MKKEALMEKTLSTEPIFSGRIFSVRKDAVALPDGRESVREVVHHLSGGACVVPLTADGKVYIVRQCRYPYADVLTEIPAGKLDLGEKPEDCAARELIEECGVRAGKLTNLGTLYPTPAYVDEVIHMYLAEDLTPAEQHLDEGEFLEVEAVPLAELVEQILRGEIKDSKTQAALLKTWILRGQK